MRAWVQLVDRIAYVHSLKELPITISHQVRQSDSPPFQAPSLPGPPTHSSKCMCEWLQHRFSKQSGAPSGLGHPWASKVGARSPCAPA